MIEITSITPFGSKNNIIRYYERILKDTNPKEEIEKAINSCRLGSINLNNDQKNILRYIHSKFPIFILGSPRTLDRIRNHFNSNGWQILIYDKKTTDFGNALINVFGYKEKFRDKIKKGIWLAKQLKIKTCPYCNAQYTLFVEYHLERETKKIAKFQFDHFFPKNQYPYFSLSLFNLIPSCASCNQTKSSQSVDLKDFYHPYYNSIADVSEFIVKYPDKVENWNFKAIRDLDPEKIELKFKSKYLHKKDFVEKHDKMFHITAVYSRHKDVAQELLVNSILYNKYYKKGAKSIEGLFPDNKTMLRYILGNYMLEDDILKRPLSKFTQDIAKQLELL